MKNLRTLSSLKHLHADKLLQKLNNHFNNSPNIERQKACCARTIICKNVTVDSCVFADQLSFCFAAG